MDKQFKVQPNRLALTIFFFLGIIFFLLYQEWLIIHFSLGRKSYQSESSKQFEKKHLGLYFWKHNRWHKEEIEILWSQNKVETLTHIVNRWLSVADEEEALPKRVGLQNVLLSESENNVYFSFDQNPFSKESSTYEKYMIIEGILKTLRESGLKLANVHFLVHHKPIRDYHLDFSQPWPIYGFST